MTTFMDMSRLTGPFGPAPRLTTAAVPVGANVSRGGFSTPPSQIPSQIPTSL